MASIKDGTTRKCMGAFLVCGLVVVSMLLVMLSTSCQAPAPAPTPSPTPTSASIEVKMSGFAFVPATVTVSVSTAVTWTNQDSATHTVTSETGLFDSGNLARNASFSHSFTGRGTFNYYCTIHPRMKGKIIVE